METRLAQPERDDASWIRSTFFVPRRTDASLFSDHRQKKDRMDALRGRQFSGAMLNYADTAIGGNRSLNPWPQFTRFADLNAPQILAYNASYGMGRQYHESIDQYAQRIWLQFGTPMHNSVGAFLAQAYSPEHGNMVNRGIVGSVVYKVAKLFAFIATSPIWAFNWAWNLGHRIYRLATRQPMTKFYYIKPGMFFYWSQFQLIINTFTVNMQLGDTYGIGNIKIKDGTERLYDLDGEAYDEGEQVPEEVLERVRFGSKGIPDVLQARNGGLDVRRAATRYQRLANLHNKKVSGILDNAASYEDGIDKLTAYINGDAIEQLGEMSMADMEAYLLAYSKSSFGSGTVKDDAGNVQPAFDDPLIDGIQNEQSLLAIAEGALKSLTADDKADGNLPDVDIYATLPMDDPMREKLENESLANKTAALKNIAKANRTAYGNAFLDPNGPWLKMKRALDGYKSLYNGELTDGSLWVSFIVDYQGSSSESFGNRTQTSTLEETINSTSAEMRRKIFNFGGGNLGDNIFADAVETVAGVFKSGIGGLLAGAGLGGIGVVGGSAHLDMPDFWEDSDSSFSGTNYKMSCVSWSAHPYAVLQNVLFPTAAMLAGTLPRTTGYNSYSSPLYCKLWSPGRTTVDTGMITDLTIDRGVTNLGFSTTNLALSADISFTVRNMCKIAHMPITNTLNLTGVIGLTLADEENLFTNYMTALSGLSMLDQYYHFPRWRLKVERARQNFDTTFSKETAAMRIISTAPGQLLSSVYENAAL